MGRKILVFLCVFYVLCAGAEAAVPNVVSVDFYPSGARFVFQLELDKDGDFEFTLPGAFMPETVRALERGAASMRAEAAQVRPEPFPELEPLERTVAEKRREVRLWEGSRNAAQHALRMLNETITSDVSGRDLANHINRVVDQASEKRLQYELALVDLVIGMEDAQEKLRDAEEELRIQRAELERGRPDRSRIVRVRGTVFGTEPVLFEAHTNDAGWAARYDINLNAETGLVSAVMYAQARQRTGLDVEGEFLFHSRAPSFSVTAPDLPPLTVRLGGRERRALSSDAVNAPMALMAASPEALMDSEVAQRREITSTLANVSIRGRGGLKGDGVPSDVELGRFEFPSAPRLIAIPEQSREAWVVADLDVIPDAFLPGVAALYVDGAASGRTTIPELGLQGTLPFGMAQRVTAEKRRAVGRSGTTWFGFGRGTLQDGYTIEVTNNMDAEWEIEVRDRLPLPADDRITIENVRIDPAPALQDSENRLTWKLTLQPGETGRIAVEFTIRYPVDETLIYR